MENNSATANTYCVLKDDSDNSTQRWRIEGVEKDFLGNYLYYKITNDSNSNLALTWNTQTDEITLANYTGANNQKWKLNLDGLDGFAGNCVVDEGEKAGTIGGLLGETVFVDTFDELADSLTRTEPLTIVITKDITGFAEKDWELRIEDNKTLIGSYAANKLQDPRFNTVDAYNHDDPPSDNIIFRNLTFSVDNVEDRMAISVYGSKNVWIDHCTFKSTLGLYYDEVGKYIWVNEDSDSGENPDFVTISYNEFNRRFWGVAFGANALGENRASVMYNNFTSIVQRAPQLGNGTLHACNNYYLRGETASDGSAYASLKCGEGSVVYSDAQRFENYQKEASGYWSVEVTTGYENSFIDVGSYTNSGETPVSVPYSYVAPTETNVTTWNPSSNYGYKIMSAYGDNDVKAFCTTYTGVVSSLNELKYIGHSDCSDYVSKTVESPTAVGYTDTSDNNTGSSSDSTSSGNTSSDSSSGSSSSVRSLEDGEIYVIKSVNSGLALEVADGSDSNGANVQQGTYTGAGHQQWKIVDNGDGYYQLYPQVGDGSTQVLDLDYANTANGTNIHIWSNTKNDGQYFKIQDNGDGTYAILTKATNGGSGLDVENVSTSSGANVQQWGYCGSANQRWTFEKASSAGTGSDSSSDTGSSSSSSTSTSTSNGIVDGGIYVIKNVNSGLALDVDYGAAANGTNVQQWAYTGGSHQQWKVVDNGDGYYQLYPQVGDGSTFVLDLDYANTSNGTNLHIWANTKNDGQFFKIQDNGDGTYAILTKATNGSSGLDVENGSTSNGANIQQWGYCGSANQKWTFELVK